MERSATGIQVVAADRIVDGERVDAGKIRRRQSGRAQAPGCGRRAAATVPAAGDGCFVARGARRLQRSLQDQPRFQESVGGDARLPQRPVSMVAGGRADLRHVSCAQSCPHLIVPRAPIAANGTYAELAQSNAHFNKMLDNFTAYRNDSYQWQAAELA